MSEVVRTQLTEEEIKYQQFVATWKGKYLDDWCTKTQLQKLVTIGRLKQEDYEMILLAKEQQNSQTEINQMM